MEELELPWVAGIFVAAIVVDDVPEYSDLSLIFQGTIFGGEGQE